MGQTFTSEVPAPNPDKGVFNAFRYLNVWPTLYGPNKTAVTVDVLESGLILAFVMLAFCFYIVLPGIRGRERIYCFIRITVSLFLGASIILCNWGQEWEVDEIHTRTQYKAFTTDEIVADVGVKIGLRNVNITLRATDGNGTDGTIVNGERINYNERFWWSFPWLQGRIGFGPYAAEINQEFREAQFKGLPYPILWIVEYFTFDGEGIRWGRNYRDAGWYAHIMLWTAFPCWIICNILFFFNPRIGAYMLLLTGFLQLIANACFGGIRNFNPLKIPFEEGALQPHFGWCFWLNLISGFLCLLIGAAVLVLDYCASESVATFFGVDVLKDYEEFYPEVADSSIPDKQPAGAANGAGSSGDAENGAPENKRVSAQPQFRKRGPTLKKNIRRPVAPPRPRLAPPGEEVELQTNGGGSYVAEAGSVNLAVDED